jgi:hypothetical protein
MHFSFYMGVPPCMLRLEIMLSFFLTLFIFKVFGVYVLTEPTDRINVFDYILHAFLQAAGLPSMHIEIMLLFLFFI